MTDPAQPSAWGSGVRRGLQEHHEDWSFGQPLPAEPALIVDGMPGGAAPVTGPPDGNESGSAAQPGGNHPGPSSPSSQPATVTSKQGPSPDDKWAMACYLGALFFWLLAPLVIYLAKRNSSSFIRSHAAQAFNLTLTATLFAVSGAIIGGLLILDSPKAALFVMGPVFGVFWIVVLNYLIRAASSASRDDFYEIPGWICVTALR
jgi:uncharacterized Tic20 family protein